MHASTQENESDLAEVAAEVFAMLADATRIRLILALDAGERSVGVLAEIVDRAPTAVSQHLAKLRLARMVATRRQGQTIYYSLVDEHARDLVRDAILQAEHSVQTVPTHHAPARKERG